MKLIFLPPDIMIAILVVVFQDGRGNDRGGGEDYEYGQDFDDQEPETLVGYFNLY